MSAITNDSTRNPFAQKPCSILSLQAAVLKRVNFRRPQTRHPEMIQLPPQMAQAALHNAQRSTGINYTTLQSSLHCTSASAPSEKIEHTFTSLPPPPSKTTPPTGFSLVASRVERSRTMIQT
ncbi:hypothetical protein J3458_004296 [Metarhizium acridum]|uniref:uncharacterized protein n=1 Tax=Metarhizium acridum TaxID=92637 RepID=UPI001C6CBCC6|nr:hypothetical protein J3458_004296 [Metarhizium acridum]